MKSLQVIGLGMFLIALLTFIAMPATEKYELTENNITETVTNTYHADALIAAAKESGVFGESYSNTFALENSFKEIFEKAKNQLQESEVPEGVGEWEYKLGEWKYSEYSLTLFKKAATGSVASSPWLFFLLTIGLSVLGGLLYIIPKFYTLPGIKNNHIYHSSMKRGLTLPIRTVFLVLGIAGMLLYGVFYMGQQYFWSVFTAVVGLIITALVFIYGKQIKRSPARSASPQITAWLGVLTGILLIGFYVLLYWSPQHIIPWIVMVDPLSKALSGNPASQWFLYGLLYTLVILVMGIRMIARYRHNRYQIIRTFSVMFFQTSFAFLLPEIMVSLGKPYMDFKNIWPLNYSFFFDWNINNLIASGSLGMFMLFWGIMLVVIAVPVITYFYGKRWYCSWVCGCGGLAETLGDPYRQLSDKSLRAWKYERWIIHGVLVFAVLMTMAVLYSYLPTRADLWLNQTTFLIGINVAFIAIIAYLFLLASKSGDAPSDGLKVGAGVVTLILGLSVWHLAFGGGEFLFRDSGSVRKWYGFLIGAGFAGVVGTGFYPIMGNRVWCRFGCPLAAYLGMVQRFKSRFRITTNGGQCISCGNCSTYCEMGIDVRSYAQKGQNIVRSSCVGCGICAAVCPRGVLRLENIADDVHSRTTQSSGLTVGELKI